MKEEEKRKLCQGFYDYDKEAIGGTNPYYMCSDCGVSEPQINGNLLNHYDTCSYRIDKLREIDFKQSNKGNKMAQDRTEYVDEITEIFKKMAEKDIRVGQAISNAMHGVRIPLHAIENEDLLNLLINKLEG